MRRSLIKFTVLTLAIVGASILLSGSKVSAAATSCPASPPGDNWGVTLGENAHAMAGLIVHATTGSYADGSGNSDTGGIPVNTDYTLTSSNPRGDNRIFIYPPNSSLKTSSWTFRTGTVLNGANSGPVQCDGWDALGPGQAVRNPETGEMVPQVGNGWVLDCAQGDVSTEFKITSIPKPAGQDGYWEIQGPDGAGTPNLSTTPMKPFHVKNGSTVNLNFIWHPEPERHIETAECHTATIWDDKSGATGSHSYTRVWISGTNNDQSNYHIGYGGSHTFSFDPISPTITIHVERFHNGSPPTRYDQYTRNIECYSAVCSIQIQADGTAPNNTVVGGHQFTAIVSVTNVGQGTARETIPAGVGGYRFSVTGTGGHYDTNFDLDPGRTKSVPITITAPNGPQNFGISFYPDYYGHGAIGPACPVNVPIYQNFNAAGIPPQSSLSPTDENPDKADYNTQVKLTGVNVPVHIPTVSCFYKEPPAKTSCTNPLINSTSGGDYSPGTTTWSGSYAVPGGSFVAGDRYCARIHMDYTSGYRGPGGPNDVIPTPNSAYDSSSCDKVTNKPFFKVMGSGASAGTALRKSDGTCSSSSGLLAGWNNNSDGQERGAGAQLSALALVKITGFASAQVNATTNTGTDAAGLTFANAGAGVSVNTDREDPDLGGSFNATGYCMDNVSAPSGGATTSTIPTAPITNSQSMFVNGDVTISNNVSYGTAADIDHVPSFVLHATGNIYIAPNVIRLDGLYVSDKKIYTCANSTGPITTNAYGTCKNQLLVHGALAADQIKLGRTFGSLRDEEPSPGTPGGQQLGLVWSCGGTSCDPPTSGMACIAINEPADNAHTWNDNKLCLPSSSPLKLAWTHTSNLELNDPSDPGSHSLAYLQSHGFPNCIPWTLPPGINGWSDNNNYLCSNQNAGLNFQTSNDPSKSCTRIFEPVDPDGNWASGYFLCEPRAAAAGLPTVSGPPFACSNAPNPAKIYPTCAAEIFELGPELYLSTPAIQTPNNGGSQWDSVTGLPPVL